MDSITPFDWHRLFIGKEPPLYFLEIVFRVILIYVFAVIMLRLVGKRGRRQMSTFELVLVIALGSATGDAMLYPEVPILYAWLIILIIVALDRLLSELQFRYKSINVFLEGIPRLMVQEGKIIEENLHKEQLRREELLGLLREQEIANTGEVGYVFLEQTGNLGVYRRTKSEESDVESTFPPDFKE
jgi:uncharacterized membrane protein YcaP (DUF421 family)